MAHNRSNSKDLQRCPGICETILQKIYKKINNKLSTGQKLTMYRGQVKRKARYEGQRGNVNDT